MERTHFGHTSVKSRRDGIEIVALFYADNDMAHYADGRPVMGHLRMFDVSQYLQPWHPSAFHDASREIRTATTGPASA
jgi:hypothetical protein